MKAYNISLEISLEANSPLEAAKHFQKWIKESGSNWQYYVQEESGKDIFSIDLEETDEDAVLIVNEYSPIIKN